jgi:MFS family permease
MSLSDTVTGRERASGNAERHRWPEMPAAAEHARRTAPSRAAFWLVAGVFCLMFFAAGAPTPLYGVYRAELRFSATTLTAIFAIYAVVLLLTLLVVGSVSDYLGRRPVILAALVVSASACAVFLAAHSAGLLFAARALQGVASRTTARMVAGTASGLPDPVPVILASTFLWPAPTAPPSPA